MKKIIFSYGQEVPRQQKLTLLLGSFDGVHRGHQQLIFEGKRSTEGDLGVLLFDKNPADLMSNGKSSAVLTSLDDRLRLFENAGLDVAYIIRIDKEFLSVSPIDFITNALQKIDPEQIVVGTDYSFGAKAAGNDALLKRYFKVDVVDLLPYDGKKISTQRIIADLAKGDLESANAQLGRPYELHGLVAHGFQKGRTIGFPTANIPSNSYALPKNGVYQGVCFVRGRPYRSLINVGVNPTVGLLTVPVIECYLKGFDEEIYGETMYVQFLSFLREEKKFASLEELKGQLQKDIASLN
jgi:riboflavin kinase/FMN adenylyltransferase